MATQRAAAPLPEFVKITAVGQQVIGKVVRHFTNDNGASIELAPVVLRNGNSGQGERFGSLALGLSTDLTRKVSAADVGKVLGIAFTGTKPSTKGSPTKLFQVFELDAADLAAIRAGVLVLPLVAEEVTAPVAAPASGAEADELPF